MNTVVEQHLADIDAQHWNALVEPDNPFMDHRFLLAMEQAGCVGHGTGWSPRYICLYRDGNLVAAAPLYIKTDSYGEFIFDWQWADAYHRSGIAYYPKATVAAPFTPASGRRLLLHPDKSSNDDISALYQEMLTLTRQSRLSGLHVLFCSKAERDALCRLGMAARLTFQFHWENRGYRDFDDFCDDLRSKKRKQFRKERRAVQESGIDVSLMVGEQIKPEHIDAMWRFYVRNQSSKFGNTYLNRAWFELIYQTMRDNLVMTLAEVDGEIIAGTFNFHKGGQLFGRYWGATRHVEYLHFECCYYRLIDYAITEGIEKFEAGAQGEHKFLRGFITRPTYSTHWFAHPNAREVIGEYLRRETAHAEATILAYNRQSPLKAIRSDAERRWLELNSTTGNNA